jgi:BirA family biotin operon repressor/biotin-[acetyl-CoA-carboxylase] ligase
MNRLLETNIIRLAETGSTNSYAIDLLSKERPAEGTVIIAGKQSNGRGTDTNTWESEAGKNLTFSLILYPTFSADQQFVLNKAISLGICDYLQAALPGHKVSIKWPNDIYIGDKKACGILIQNSVMGNSLVCVVVGIGLNVNQTVFTSDAPNPVSMKMSSGVDYDLDAVLQSLLFAVSKRYAQVKPDTNRKIENDYLSVLYRFREWHHYIVKGVNLLARITGTSPYGQLLLATEAGEDLVCDLREVKIVV